MQSYQGLGPVGNQFNSKFLRSSGAATLTLSNLPDHDRIDLGFLLAIIDSWDGGSSDYFNVTVDGFTLFRETFSAFNLGNQTYNPQIGGLISFGTQLGFNSSWNDSAYDMHLDPKFQSSAHTSSTLTIQWLANGPGWEAGTNESWAIDNLQFVLWKNQFDVPGTLGANSLVGNLSTRNIDLASTFTYSLVAGTGDTDNARFSISGNTLQTAEIFNYEAKTSYTIRVRTTDQDGLWFEKDLAVSVTNVNEAPTDLSLSGTTVAEDAPLGTAIGTFTTADPDTGNTFTYTLIAGTGDADNSRFIISGNTLKTADILDYEDQSSHSIRVRTKDQGGLTYEKVFTITVTNVNEGPLKVLAVSPMGPLNHSVSTMQVTFSQRVDLNTLSLNDVTLMGPSGAISLQSITPVAGSRDRTFDLEFAGQSADGEYTVAIGPQVSDLAGNTLASAARYGFTIDTVGPRALSADPTGTLKSAPDHVDIVFTEELSLFPANQVTLAGPSGAITVGTPSRIAAKTWRIPFAKQSASGDYTLTVGPGVRDLAGNALDQDADGVPGEATDDQFTTTFSLALADLAPSQLSAPSTAAAGQTVTVSWKTTNLGASTGAIPVKETLWLSDDANPCNDRYLGEFSFADVGDHTAEITLPTYGQGSGGLVRLVVVTDTGSTVEETDESNNQAIASAAIDIPLVLSVTLPASQAREGDAPLRGVVMRTGSTTNPLVVTLASSDETEVTVPATVTIPAGQSGVSFLARPLTDATPDGNQVITLTASAAGFPDGVTGLAVLDADKAHLTLQFPVDELAEGESATVTVTREVVTDQPLLVSLAGSSSSQISLPASVVIPAGEASATFTLTALDDIVPEPQLNVSVVASATNHIDGGDSLLLPANDTPQLSFSLNRTMASETTANPAFTATVRRAAATAAALTIRLDISNTASLQGPATVVIPAGSTSVSFSLNTKDNTLAEGDRDVTIDAYGAYPGDGSRIADSRVSRTVTITDDDGPTLSLSLDRQFAGEGLIAAARGTVTRNTATADALTVTLASSRETEATVPLQVTIPAGQASVEFPIDTVADGVTDGTWQVTITASAEGFSAGSAVLSVSDQDVPDLVVSEITLPGTAVTDSFVDVGFRITNQGLAAASGTITQTLYLSSDPVVGNDTLLNSYSFTGTLQSAAPLNTFAQTVPVRLPKSAGNYWIIVQTNSLNAILEGIESNNTRVSATPVVVAPAYTATVETDLTQALANTPVDLRGSARDTLTGGPAAFVLVNIDLTVRGFRRTISAVTDANGNFRTTFKPLPGEAGRYSIAAYHPGSTAGDAQDLFTLVGMAAEPAKPAVKLIEAATDPTLGQVTIKNLSEVALTGVNVQIVSHPANVDVTVTLADGTADQTLLGSGELVLAYTLQATDDTTPGGGVLLRRMSAEGATLDVPV
ncbi:MAG: cadherin domain-containing protein, partial [Planctomycetaceae bacterium]